jgi:hypothetical protein
MAKSTDTIQDKAPKPRGRNGGRKSTVHPDAVKEQANVWLPKGLNRELRALIPEGSDRNALFAEWVAEYLATMGDREISE